MNRIFPLPIAFVMAVAFSAAAIGPAGAAELTVKLHGIRAQGGLVKVALVESQDAWDGKTSPTRGAGGPAAGEDATFAFKDLKPGDYAVMITHDENGNGKLDTNVMGMPLEGYGFSNNPQVMRKPTWDEACFTVADSDVVIDIDLR